MKELLIECGVTIVLGFIVGWLIPMMYARSYRRIIEKFYGKQP